MQREPPKPSDSKSSHCPISRQINQYRNSLPEVPRSENFFFFKQITRNSQQISYITIGYRVGQIPFELMDLFAVVVNDIHCFSEANLKVILQDDQLWVTSTTGFPSEDLGSTRLNIEEAHTSEALIKTRNLMQSFLEECSKQSNRKDSDVLEEVRTKLAKNISLIFKNPYLDD